MLRRRATAETGVTVVALAITLPVILSVLGLAVDLGLAYSTRSSAQAAADAAALAGAFSYVDNPTVSDSDVHANATLAGQQNLIYGQPANVTSVQTADCNGSHCVSVTVQASSATFFARLFNWTSLAVSARATARAGNVANGSYCAKPVLLPSALMATLTGGSPIPDIRPTNTPATASSIYSIDFTRYPASSLLRFTDGSSESSNSTPPIFRDVWSHCLALPIKCQDSIPVSTAGMLRTGQGVKAANFVDVFNSVGNYGAIQLDTSGSLISVPVWDSTNVTGTDATVVGFAQLFVDPYTDALGATPATAHLIRYTSCSGAGTSTGPFGVPVQLVQ
jgi:Flp pilus assembly protein TadG